MFMIFAGGSGLFAILALTTDVEIISTTGTIIEGTTWDEYEGTREECAVMGYYYDEYGEEYQECEEYRTITYYRCSTNVDFSYVLADDDTGYLYGGEDRVVWADSSSSCLSDIESVYAVNKTVSVYYLSDNPDGASLSQPLDPSGIYVCCSACFGLLAIPALMFMVKRSPGVGVKSGGMIGRLRPQRISIAGPNDFSGGPNAVNYQGQGTQTSNAGQSRGGYGAGGMMIASGMGGGMAGGAAFSPGMPQATGANNANNQQRVSRSQNIGGRWYSPSRKRGYDSVINQLRLKDQTTSTSSEVIQRITGSGMMDHQNASKFVSSSYVSKALGLSVAAGAAGATVGAISQAQEETSQSRLEAMKEEASAFFDSAKPKVNTTSSRPVPEGETNQCAHPTCSTTVSAFDFRCFDCRRRFCTAHKGMTFQCADCAN